MSKITDTFDCIPRNEESILRFQMLRSDIEARRDVIELIEEKIRRKTDEQVNDIKKRCFSIEGEEIVKSTSLMNIYRNLSEAQFSQACENFMKGLIWVSTGYDDWENFDMLKKSGLKTHFLGQLYCKLQKEKGAIVDWLEDCLLRHRNYILLDFVDEAHYSNLGKKEYQSAYYNSFLRRIEDVTLKGVFNFLDNGAEWTNKRYLWQKGLPSYKIYFISLSESKINLIDLFLHLLSAIASCPEGTNKLQEEDLDIDPSLVFSAVLPPAYAPAAKWKNS